MSRHEGEREGAATGNRQAMGDGVARGGNEGGSEGAAAQRVVRGEQRGEGTEAAAKGEIDGEQGGGGLRGLLRSHQFRPDARLACHLFRAETTVAMPPISP